MRWPAEQGLLQFTIFGVAHHLDQAACEYMGFDEPQLTAILRQWRRCLKHQILAEMFPAGLAGEQVLHSQAGHLSHAAKLFKMEAIAERKSEIGVGSPRLEETVSDPRSHSCDP
jgi:hypothetical protein